MMNDTIEMMEELTLDLEVLVLLTDPGFTPKVRGFLCAGKIERYVRERFDVRTVL